MKGLNKMYNENELFNEENFKSKDIDKMIDSAINLYIKKGYDYPGCFWISYDSLEAVEVADDEEELENLTNGFIVDISPYHHIQKQWKMWQEVS